MCIVYAVLFFIFLFLAGSNGDKNYLASQYVFFSLLNMGEKFKDVFPFRFFIIKHDATESVRQLKY